MEPAITRPTTVSGADAGVVLSPDVLCEILLRVQAEPLCRFRAVCRLWRSLLSDPSFVKAHAALHPDLILTLAGDNDRIDMMDLSGNVVRRMGIAHEDIGVLHHAHPGPLYLLLDHNRVRIVDPDSGAVSTLPFDDLQHRFGSSFEGTYALGCVASTGQHKILRILSRNNRPTKQHCDVFTLGGDDDCWRPTASAPLCVKFHTAIHHIVAHNAVIQGVVYFLTHKTKTYCSFDIVGAYNNVVINTYSVMSFDLEAEEWRPATLPGPPAINNTDQSDCVLKLAKLNGRLVMIRQFNGYRDRFMVEIDMWFATDLEKGLWVKEHRIRLLVPMLRPWVFAPDIHLLRVLDDGRVVFCYSRSYSSGNCSWPEPDWRTRIYDPRTKSCTNVCQHGVRYIAGMYGGSICCAWRVGERWGLGLCHIKSVSRTASHASIKSG